MLRVIPVFALAFALTLAASVVNADGGAGGMDSVGVELAGEDAAETGTSTTIREDDTAVGAGVTAEGEREECKNAVGGAWGALAGAYYGGILGGIVGTLAGPAAGFTMFGVVWLAGILIGGAIGGPEKPPPKLGASHDHDGASAPGGPVELGRERTAQ